MKEVENMPLTNRENMLLVYQHKTPEYLPLTSDVIRVSTPGAGLQSVTYGGKPAAQFAQQDGGLDWFGQNWIYEKGINAINPDATNYIIKDVTKWRDYVTLPDVDSIDWKARFEKENIQLDRENKLVSVGQSIGMWERAFSMIEMTDLLTALILEPEAMHDFFDEISNHFIKLFGHYIDFYRPDILRMNDDYGHGHGMFMSPDTWRAVIKPYLKRIVDFVVSKGVMYEHHCCGYIVPIVDDIIELGASAWNLVHFCNDPPAVKERFGGRIALMGGMLNTAMMDAPSTTEEMIREHISDFAAKLYPGIPAVMGCGLANFPERNAIVNDEILKSGNKYFSIERPA